MTVPVLIENGMVIDGTGAPARAEAVLLEGASIVAVGAEATQRAAQARRAERLDVRGMTVMPGLIDTHCHLSFDDAASNAEIFHHRRPALSAVVAAANARKLLRAGVTGLLDPDSIYECMVDVRDAIDAGVVEGPRIACGCYALITGVGGTAGRLINDEGVTGYYKVVSNKDEIVTEIRRQVKVGADWIKVHVTGIIPRQSWRGEVCVWTDEELRLICDTAHDLGTPVMAHCRGADATYRAAKAGFDLIFHATAMDERALEIVIEKKIPISPALTFQANMVDFGHKLGTDPSLVQLFEREITESVETMSKAYKAGVPLMCGSEAGFSMVPYGEWHYREMEVFVRYFGLTNLQAIQCGTQAGAVALRREGKTGVVAAGYDADVIVVDGDPSKDVTILGEKDRIKHVWVGGRKMDLSPLPERKHISGWKLASMGKHLDRKLAFSNTAAPAESVAIEELH
jgi:imidazolonepropionase-like amidohydrolase